MEWTQPAGGSSTGQNHPKPPAHASAAPPTASVAASNAKKRPLEDIKNSPYYKMRAILRDLRPHFMEVLGAPDFRNCKGAEEIAKMKIFMTLYKEMMNETTENKRFFTGTEAPPKLLSKVLLLNLAVFGLKVRTSLVGPLGWNYVTFPGSKSVYYGRTKEEFRAAVAAVNTKPQ